MAVQGRLCYPHPAPPLKSGFCSAETDDFDTEDALTQKMTIGARMNLKTTFLRVKFLNRMGK